VSEGDTALGLTVKNLLDALDHKLVLGVTGACGTAFDGNVDARDSSIAQLNGFARP